MNQNVLVVMGMFALFDDDEEDNDMDDRDSNLIELAIALERVSLNTHLGRGHITTGVPRNRSLLGFNTSIVDYVLSEPAKCINIIGFTSKEFYHVLPYVEREVRRKSGTISLAHHKATIRQRLFILLFFLSSNLTMRKLEVIFNLAKASIHEDVIELGQILLNILKIQVGSLWPNRAERDLLRQFLPGC